MSKLIKTQRPNKGDLVKGHAVYIHLPKVPATPAKVVDVSASGHAVTVEISTILAVLAGMKRRWEFTWRESMSAYQPKGQSTRKGCGLALVR